MAVPVGKTSFVTGEISPDMMGRQDVDRYHSALSTCRNFFVSYVGGINSRAGTAFVGYSKQTGRQYPPRLIEFQFSNNQGLALEFGNLYMRAVSNGAFITEAPIGISAISLTNPATITVNNALGVATATAVNTGVLASYNTGETITLAGGTYVTQAAVSVTNTTLATAYPSTPGRGYVPSDTVVFAGGTHSSTANGTVTKTQVSGTPTLVAVGTGGTPGTQIVTGTTGTGTKFQLSVTVSGGGTISSINSVLVAGSYTTNPTLLTAEPVTGGGLTGAIVSILMGAQTISVTSGGVYTVNPPLGALTQASTSGSGTGLICTGVFAPNTVSVSNAGKYSALPANPVGQASTSGTGVGAQFNLTSSSVAPPLNAGDWIYISGVGGTTQFNGETFVIHSIASNVLTIYDVFGNAVDATAFTAYTSGGTVARIYTLTTIYAEVDLPYLKIVQSADTMSICCLNTVTGTEYVPQDLTRNSDTNWSFSPTIPTPSVLPPATVSGVATATGTVNYEYVVTALDPVDGTESIASPIASISNAVDIASTAGSITISWTPVAGVQEYYVYKALPGYGAPVQSGSQFGYAGLSYGNSFVDSNITADFAQAPPTHANPFARGAITGATSIANGTGYTTAVLSITSGTGTDGKLTAIISNGGVTGAIVQNEGINYKAGDPISITGDGTGAVLTLQVGPQSGTYPSSPAYFQQRRGYANSLNNPDTYWFSQPGAFTNFDVRNPTIASDAITGSPWAVQVNGVQWMIQTSGGLLVMTGLRAWMLVGSGSFATNVQPISPSNQNDVPQAFTGASPLIQPVLINFDVLYVDPNNVYYYDLPYQLYALSEPIDLTDVCAHLFTGYTVIANAYCEKPYRLIWSVRSDGALLSLTYYKTQKVQGWGRHDTQGFFVGCCSVLEPPVNALYLATNRFPGGGNPYMIERMDNRIWANAESVWAVDCGLAYPQPQPAANLLISSATGLGAITGGTVGSQGTGYSPLTTGTVVDQFGGSGTGAIPVLNIVGGALVSVSFPGGQQGSGYTQPLLVLNDPAGSAGGSGASVSLTLSNTVALNASASVFTVPGQIIRAGGGMIAVASVTSGTVATGNVLSPIVNTVPDTGQVPQINQGQWTMTTPVSVVSGLRHLAGITVTGLADGNVIPPTVVSAAGTITLATPASAIVVGLGFQCQAQDVPIDTGAPTIQGQRKKLTATTLRLAASRGVKVGSNQRDGSSLSPLQIAVPWINMQPLPDSGPGTPNFPPVPYNALCTPLRTGDIRTALAGGTVTPGQLAIQQDFPLPANVVAIYSELLSGDTPQLQVPQKRGGPQQ